MKWVKQVNYGRTNLKVAYEDLIKFWEDAEGDTRDNRTDDLRYPIIQIYMHMIRTMTIYGVLSTLDHTWFLKLDK